MSLPVIHDAICRYFGGDYDPEARAYLDPQVPGLGIVKRARGKRASSRDLHGGMDTEEHGTAMLVHLDAGVERRVAVAGATNGMKLVSISVALHVFLHSKARYAEDAQDAFLVLHQRLLERIRADRTLGSGGFENQLAAGVSGFQVGEGESSGIRWDNEPAETAANVTRGYLMIQFEAHHHVWA